MSAAAPPPTAGPSAPTAAPADAPYRTLVEHLPAVTYVASAAEGSATLYASPQVEALLGYAPGEWTASPTLWLDRIHASDRARVEEEWAAAHGAGRPFAAEYRLLARDGRTVWVRDEAVLVRGADGLPLRIQGVMLDVTGRRETEEALRRHQESLRALQRITASADLPFADKVAALLEMGCRRFGAPTGVLSRIADGWFHVLEAHAPGGELARGSQLPLEQLFCAATLALGDALAIDHAGASALAAHPCRTARGVEAYLGTPVAVEGRGYGTLSFFGPRPRTVPFSEGDRDFLRLMSQWVGAELERQRTLAELRAGEARYRTLVESASDLIFSTDDAGTLTYCNPAALRTLGLAAGEAVGQPALALVRPDAREGARAALAAQAAERREAGYLELPLRAAGGREVWVGLSLQLAFDGERLEGVRAVARDITARRELDRVHAEFVSVVSHELRTPLTALRAALGLLAAGRAGPVPEEGRRLLEIAVGNTDRLARLVGDIVEMEGLQSGRAALRVEEVHAATLLARAADAASGAAQRQGVHLAVRAVPARLHADAARLRQVLAHLLDNALKFSPRGGTVTLAATREGGELRLRVSDGGPGIPADGLEAVFERFRQGDSSDARGKGGTGLGLALCRGIVEQHGGRIWAESPPGGGATLWVALPLAQDGPTEHATVRRSPGDGG